MKVEHTLEVWDKVLIKFTDRYEYYEAVITRIIWDEIEYEYDKRKRVVKEEEFKIIFRKLIV
jgi:hypothetical protein